MVAALSSFDGNTNAIVFDAGTFPRPPMNSLNFPPRGNGGKLSKRRAMYTAQPHRRGE